MQNQTLHTDERDQSAEAGPPGWLAFSLVTSSYFVALAGVIAYCIVLP